MFFKILNIFFFVIAISNLTFADYCSEAKPCGTNPCFWLYEWSSYLCDCSNGQFSLNKTCVQIVDSCVSNPCINGGTCSVSNSNKFSCSCPSGFSGQYCEIKLLTPDVCSSINPCSNGGKCLSIPNNFYCQCPPQFTGFRCETINNCNSSICINGDCVVKNGEYTCECRSGWGGSACNNSLISKCQPTSILCLNGGTCRDVYSGIFPVGYSCICPPEFTGEDCGTSNVIRCSNNSCINGLCFDQNTGFTCKCFTGWSGEKCDIKLVCDANTPCLNGGTCAPDGRSCLCPQFFNGTRCENINGPICATNICSNGGTCYQLYTRLYCLCTDKYYGQYCELI